MVSGRLEDLHHGHLGDITYNSEAKEWIFPRDLAETRQLRQAGEETIQLEPSVSIATGQVQPMVSRIKNTTSLLLENPELIPAGSGLLLPLAQESENVVVASDLNDPLSSDLYAFGRFEDVKQETFSRERKSKVLAIAGGQSGEAVRLIRIEEYDAKSNIHGGTRLSVLSLNQKHVGWWVDTNGPVQQVCFSESNGVPGGWLAVRKLTSITIFRPRSHERPVSQTVPRHLSAHYPGSTCSTLEMNPVVVVSAQGAHEPYYADLVFNPFRNKQLAAIDVIGTLRVWELEMTTKNRWEAVPIELTNEGDLTIHHEKLYPSDGWGRVMWAGNAHTILTVSRTSIIAHTTEINQHSSEIFETRPKIKNMPMVDPILDVRQTSNDNSSIFILTSERICLLRILAVDGDEYALKAEIASSWKHYRAEEDYTIRLSITRVENVSLVLVYSRMTALITYYIVTIPQLADIGVATVSDAFHLPLGPDSRLGHCRFDPLRDQQKIGFVLMSLLPLSYEEAQMEDYEDADMDTQTEIKFFQLWGLSGNLSLTERLCTFTKSLQEANELSITRKPCHIETPRTRNGRGFIVPDGYLSDGEGCVQPRLWMSRHSRRNRFKRTNMVGHRGHTINMRWTRRICQRVADLRAAEQSKSQSMKSLDAALERFNEVRNDLPPGIHTLDDALPAHLPLNELAQAGEKIQILLDDFDEETRFQPSIMSSPACILLTHYLLTLEMASQFAKDRDENSELVLVPTYECIRDLMLGSLSRDVPGRTRITIEKEVRQVVMLIYLSAYGIQPIRQSGRVTRRASSDYVTDRFALPVRSRMTPPSSPPVRPFQRLPQSPQDVYRTPPPSQHTSSQTLPSINHLGSDAEDYSPYDGLRRLADISAKHLWSASSDTMLESWIIGEHPSEMDADYMLSRLKNKDTDETPRRKRQAHRPSSQHMMGSAFPGSSQSEAQIRRPQLEDPMPSSSQLLPLMTAPNIISSSQGEKSRKTPKKKKKKRRLEGF